jgi:hypothetical protein
MRTKAFSPPSYYLQQVLPKMLELGCVLLSCFPCLEIASDSWNLGIPYTLSSPYSCSLAQGCAYCPFLK